MARSGSVITALLDALNGHSYFQKQAPKSLGLEWLRANHWPILESYDTYKLEDQMRTVVEHIAMQVGSQLPTGSCLITGGGAFNTFLIERIQHHTHAECILPNYETIEFKEAICFAFLGWRRLRNEINTSASVTGASKAISAGTVHFPRH